MIIAGVMTGTSMDGIDVALCSIEPASEGDRQTVALLASVTAPYPAELRWLIDRALQGQASMEELSDLPYFLARAYADVLMEMPNWNHVQAVGVHGQTLWHHPPVSTWQAVSGTALAEYLGVPVVYDFRASDVAHGGQGAPLVPRFDHTFLGSPEEHRAALNIGGMANLTLLPADTSINQVRAFDTGPGNVLINALCEKTFGKRYDAGGSIARSGTIIDQAFSELRTHPFFFDDPPKSTGREVFGPAMAEALYRRYAHPSVPSEDLVTTLTELTAWSVGDHLRRYQPDCQRVLVAGGGVHNTYLMERLAVHCGSAVVESTTSVGIDPDAKEAMCFAWLAWRTLHRLPGNVPSVTGARREVILGSVAGQPVVL